MKIKAMTLIIAIAGFGLSPPPAPAHRAPFTRRILGAAGAFAENSARVLSAGSRSDAAKMDGRRKALLAGSGSHSRRTGVARDARDRILGSARI